MIVSNASQLSTSESSADKSTCSNQKLLLENEDLQVRVISGRDGTLSIDHHMGRVLIDNQRHVRATFHLVDRWIPRLDGHVDVTFERPWNHDAYRVTIDTPYLHVAATVDEYGNYQVNLKVLDGTGNIKQNKLFQGNQFVPISFKV